LGGHDYIDLDRHPEVRTVPGLLIARPEAPLFFANAERIFAAIAAKLTQERGVHTVIVSLEESPDLDGTSIEVLQEFARRLEAQDVSFLLARVKDRVRDALRSANLAELPEAHFAPWSVDDAVAAAQAQALQQRSEGGG